MVVINIKVDEKDVKKMDTICKEIYLHHHPEMKRIKLSRKKMYYEIVKFYIETP